jgi:antagonist of KipI
MGIRLEGPPIPVPEGEMISEPVCPGSIQVTRDGQCIILGVDGQTIGGYPKIAQVISADRDLLGQLRPGDRVRFNEIGLEEAEGRYLARDRQLRQWCLRLQTISEGNMHETALQQKYIDNGLSHQADGGSGLSPPR